MDISSFMLNNDMGGLLITLAGQSILTSLIGFAVLKVLSKRSAPVRSLVCSATMIALGLTLVISIGFYIKGISWSQATLPFVTEDNSKNSSFLPTDQNTITSGEIRALPLEGPSQIPVERNITNPEPGISPHSAPFVLPVFPLSNIAGLIWLVGILFQVVRLGYGIIFVKKFRNSLQKCRNDKYDKMLQAVAGRFWKKRLPKLYSSSLIKSPVTIGIFNPVVIIPQRLSSIITEDEMKSILLHELAHIYHYDQVAGMIKRFVIAFHWWNPLVYLINRHHEQTREEVSDNYVLGELQPKVYSQCLMDLTKKVCLISSYPTAVGMAGRRFNLRERVEQILSKKRSIAMGTKLHLKVTGFSICLVLTFGIAGLHARVGSVKDDDTVRLLREPLQTINSVSITKEDQNLTHKNILTPEAVDKSNKLQPISDSLTIPKKELSVKQAQENEKPVMSMASVDIKSKNKTEKRMDSAGIKQDNEPVIKKDEVKTIVLAQNKTAIIQSSKATTVPDKAVPNIRLEDATNDTKKEDIDTAIAELSRQIELNDSDAGRYQLRGNLYMDKQDYRQALNDYTKVIEINPDDDLAYNNRGQVYANMGEYKKAIKDYKKAIKKDPENKNAYINRGNAYFARQSYQKAISDYTRAIKIDPELSSAYKNRGNAYLRKNSLSKAIQDFSKALELNVRDAGSYLLRGNAYYSKGEYRQAINDYNRALVINPDLIDAYNNRGMAYEDMGQLDKAIYDYSKAIGIVSKDPDAYIKRKLIYTQNSRTYKAGRANPMLGGSSRRRAYYTYDDYKNRFPMMADVSSTLYDYSDPHINRGRLYIKINQLDKALSDFSKAIEINPDSDAAYNYRTIVYTMMGNKYGYEKDEHMAKQLNPDYTLLETTAEKEIENLRNTRGSRGYNSSGCGADYECTRRERSWLGY